MVDVYRLEPAGAREPRREELDRQLVRGTRVQLARPAGPPEVRDDPSRLRDGANSDHHAGNII